MIVVRISGGLGNQMFQYAYGKHIAFKHKTELLFDNSFFDSEENKAQKREFLLNKFSIEEKTASDHDFQTLGLPSSYKKDTLSRLKKKIFRIFDSLKPIENRKIIIEQNFKFNAKYLSVGNNTYCAGNWQSEKYFKDIKEEIYKKFSLPFPLSSRSVEILNAINSSTSVSIHVRRGDYVTNQAANKKHGTLDKDYYSKALDFLNSKLNNPTFFIFSDDINWAKNNLGFPTSSIYVSDSQIENIEEMILMSSCSHNIVANSSFSWWAAWLNKNPNKIVIAPQKWFAQGIDTSDLIPTTWTTI